MTRTVQRVAAIGKQLTHPPHTKDAILKQLKQAVEMLSEMKQSQDVTASMEPLTKALALPIIIKHKDKDVRLLAISCIMEILRIVAPEAPYSDKELQDIFYEVVSAFEGLTETSNISFSRRTTVLEIMANLRISVVMLDVGCDDLITVMFQTFFSVISDKHPPSVLAAMQSIMAAILEESEKIPTRILDMILNNLLKHKKAGLVSFTLSTSLGLGGVCEQLEDCMGRLVWLQDKSCWYLPFTFLRRPDWPHPPSVVMWSIWDAAATFGTQEDRLRTWLRRWSAAFAVDFQYLGRLNGKDSLLLVEFAYNNTIHSSMGKAPFEIVEGAMKVPPFLSTKDKILEANEYTRDLDTDFAKVRETLQKSQERQKKAADCHRCDLKPKENDWVLLRFDKVRLRQKKGKEELSMRYYGPFQITEQINDISFRLRLPDTWKIHNVFHVNLWKTFGDVPDDGEPDEQPEVEANEEILVPEQVLAHKVTKKGKARRRFLIEFKNFPAFDAKWMEEEDLADTPQILKLYLEAFGIA
ncbi:hypothetical protein L7F22_057605 [Adiantum nelumboides]|nr:hypothetical protein [Adiantum nelumboides]